MNPTRQTLALIAAFGLSAIALAQTAEPISPSQYAAQEAPATPGGVSYASGQLTPPPNLMDLLAQCNAPAAVIYDSNKSGKPDTLKVYGVSRIEPQLWSLRGPSALGPASEKAELRAKAYAAEFLNGVSVFQQRLLQSSDSTTSTAATSSSSPAGGGAAAVALLSEIRETLSSVTGTNVQGFLRFGRLTGTRLVSLGTYGMCVVVRYELPLDQTRSSAPTGTPAAPSAPTNPSAPATPGFPPLPTGSAGDF